MKTVIEVYSLVIEVTRRCNMACPHCLRGEAENMDITEDVLADIAKNIRPRTVTFTGGEPSLNVKAIERYFELAEQNSNMPASFYVVTNGKEHQEELAIALLRAYPKMETPYFCGVALSVDSFHELVDGTSILRGLSFFNDSDKAHSLSEPTSTWVINEGRAAKNGLGSRPGPGLSDDLDDLIEDWRVHDGALNFDVDTLYVSCSGDVVNDCDASYDNIDTNALCNIKDLPEVLEQYVAEKEDGEMPLAIPA